MLWATLAFLGVPIWLVLGALIGATYSRHQFKAQPDVVPLMWLDDGDEFELAIDRADNPVPVPAEH